MFANHPTIEKKLFLHLLIALLMEVLVSYGLLQLVQYIFDKDTTPFIIWLRVRADSIFFLWVLIGFCSIFYYYWKKPWKYLREIIDATQIIYQQNDNVIRLSEPLNEIENRMNHIKMSVLLSQQAVRDAENKKDDLVMYLAHDIRTPLTSVIGYLSLLEEAPDMPKEQKAKYVGIALEKAQRLEKLIDEFFEITRYNTQRIQLKKEKVDLYYMLMQMIDEFYPILSAKGNTAVLHADEGLSAYADPEKLARVFNNILKNAVAYSYPHTEITISAKTEDGRTVISFQNHGTTIPPDQLSRIFEKFIRLDEARISDTGGTGLGLSIAKEIIHLHGGDISALSEKETVTFLVSLPALA